MPFLSCNTDNIVTGAASVCINGIDIGLTTGGVAIRTEREFVETEADQIVGIAKRSLQNERMFITTTLLEVSLEQMRVAFGYPVANLGTEIATSSPQLSLGYNISCGLPENTIAVAGPGPGCGCRTWVFDRAVSVSSPEFGYQKDQEVQFAVEFEILKNCETGLFGVVVDGCEYQNSITCVLAE